MDLIFVLLIAAGALVLGGVGGYLIFRFVLKGKYNEMVEAANKEAEVVKEKKLLEVKEKFLNKKSELEKEIQQRNQQAQQTENKLKQRELSLNQRQEELSRKSGELNTQQQRLDNEKRLLSVKAEELEKMQLKEREMLEEVSGLSAEDAKNRLIESMKDEAKTAAASYINEIMDEAKLNADQEAKKIVIKTIQRVATETAIENSVSVFHIENDEVKGRIIGREGRNIRALEAAAGVEIVVDDTPEAIVISGFDPVRREVCRLALHQLVSDGRIHVMAAELGLNPKKAKRAGLLHDIGKVPDEESEMPHALYGAKIAEQFKEKPDIRLLSSSRRNPTSATPSEPITTRWRCRRCLLRLFRYAMPLAVPVPVPVVRLLRPTSNV